jgi:hypothetical protein
MRHAAKLVLTGAAALAVVSCSFESVGPSRGAPPVISKTNPALAALAIPSSLDFVIPAEGGSVSLLGMYTLSFPANAVCDPNAQDSQDGYAAADWDAPCTVLGSDLAVHATLKWSHERLWIDFSPAIRFSPSTVVTLSTGVMSPIVQYFSDNGADASDGRSRTWGIAYAPALEATPVVDSWADPTVATHIDFVSGQISRRIKHFSGYSIATGLACTVSPDDPDCVEFPPDGGH